MSVAVKSSAPVLAGWSSSSALRDARRPVSAPSMLVPMDAMGARAPANIFGCRIGGGQIAVRPSAATMAPVM
jgi:hypothetical protein